MSRLKGKSFDILAVSLDDTLEELTGLLKARKVPGIHTWHKLGWENPVRTLYNVQSMPTWYLIGPDGVIRNRNPFGDELVPAVQAALASRK